MQHLGECKTEASRKPVPLDPRLAESLYNWRLASPYPRSEDWVFASPHSNGKLPYWPGAFYRAHILPAAKKLGIEGIGWHTFRRTYATSSRPTVRMSRRCKNCCAMQTVL